MKSRKIKTAMVLTMTIVLNSNNIYYAKNLNNYSNGLSKNLFADNKSEFNENTKDKDNKEMEAGDFSKPNIYPEKRPTENLDSEIVNKKIYTGYDYVIDMSDLSNIGGGTDYRYDKDREILEIIGSNKTYLLENSAGDESLTSIEVNVNQGEDVHLTLNGLNINVAGVDEKSAIDIKNGNVYLTIEGKNVLKSGNGRAGIDISERENESKSIEIIGNNGELEILAGEHGAGIGSSKGYNVDGIIIRNCNITTTGGANGSGIGGGDFGVAKNIYMEDSTIEAEGRAEGAGIGGGGDAGAENIEIVRSNIKASSLNGTGVGGSGIGAGRNGSSINIIIKDSKVTASTGSSGAGIGGGYGGFYGGVQGGDSFGVTITNSIIDAYGTTGIGGGYAGNSFDITIEGSEVKAVGIVGAGIGGGGKGYGADGITIKNSTIYAEGSRRGGAGIGGGAGGDNDNPAGYAKNILIDDNSFITATASGDVSVGIGSGNSNTGKWGVVAPENIVITGGNIFITDKGNHEPITKPIFINEAGEELSPSHIMVKNAEGEFLEGVQLTIGDGYRAKTNADGEAIVYIPEAEHDILIEKSDYYKKESTIDAKSKKVHIYILDEAEVPERPLPGGEVPITIQNEKGEAIEGAEITMGSLIMLTDEEGRTVVRITKDQEINIFKSGYEIKEARISASSNMNQIFVLKEAEVPGRPLPGGEVPITVQNEKGEAIEGAEITMGSLIMLTDEEGRTVVRITKDQEINIFKSGYEIKEAKISASSNMNQIFVLKEAEVPSRPLPGGEVPITVQNEKGEAIEGAEITMGSVTMFTDEEGRATVRITKDQEINIFKSGYEIKEARISASSNMNQIFVLKEADVPSRPLPGGEVPITVQNEKGEAIEGAEITMGSLIMLTDEEGRTVVRITKDQEINIFKSGYEIKEAKISASSNMNQIFVLKEAEVPSRPLPGGEVPITVQNEKGEEIEEAEITMGNFTVLTDEEGRAVVRITKDQEINIFKSGYEIKEAKISASSNMNQIFVLKEAEVPGRPLPGGEVPITVQNEKGEAIEGAEITMGSLIMLTDEEGRTVVRITKDQEINIFKSGYEIKEEKISATSNMNQIFILKEADVPGRPLPGGEVPITVQNEKGEEIEEAEITMGNLTVLTDEEGRAVVRITKDQEINIFKAGYEIKTGKISVNTNMNQIFILKEVNLPERPFPGFPKPPGEGGNGGSGGNNGGGNGTKPDIKPTEDGTTEIDEENTPIGPGDFQNGNNNGENNQNHNNQGIDETDNNIDLTEIEKEEEKEVKVNPVTGDKFKRNLFVSGILANAMIVGVWKFRKLKK